MNLKFEKIKGITIHNSGNSLSADEIYNQLKTNGINYLAHYLVDDEKIINSFPLEFCSFHTGKGYDFGNKYTISIEILRSDCDIDQYLKAQNNAIILIKELLDKYDLDFNQIYFHNDFNKKTYCPHRILDLYGSKENFIRRNFHADSNNGRQ